MFSTLVECLVGVGLKRSLKVSPGNEGLTKDVLNDWRHEERGRDQSSGENHEGESSTRHNSSRRLSLLTLDISLKSLINVILSNWMG